MSNLILLMAAVVALVAKYESRRLRPWVIGMALFVGGFATHAAFDLWMDFPGRIEMGAFAGIEAILFPSGLGLVLISLAKTPDPGSDPSLRAAAWLLWLVAASVAGFLVLIRLPP